MKAQRKEGFHVYSMPKKSGYIYIWTIQYYIQIKNKKSTQVQNHFIILTHCKYVYENITENLCSLKITQTKGLSVPDWQFGKLKTSS